MNSSTIKTIQTNSILKVFIAKVIYGKVNWIFQMYYKKKLHNGLELITNFATLWLILCSLGCETSGKTFSELLFSGTLRLTILRGGSKTPATYKMEPFYSSSYLHETVNYCSKYSMSKCCMSLRSASDNCVLFYYTKAILISLVFEFKE